MKRDRGAAGEGGLPKFGMAMALAGIENPIRVNNGCQLRGCNLILRLDGLLPPIFVDEFYEGVRPAR